MSFYKSVIRPVMFRLDAEQAHRLTVAACSIIGAIPLVPRLISPWLEHQDSTLELEVAGIRFANPIGLAAGWDKSGRAVGMLDSMGFGFVEIGSVSARPSRGNPRPRLFRLPADQAIIVNYGLPNDGAQVVAQRVAKKSTQHPLGINLVKTNDGPNAEPFRDEDILTDYHRSATLTHHRADYLMLNLSCPNADGGQDFFAQPGNIKRLLERLEPIGICCPVFLKLAPRDDPAEHERILAECSESHIVSGFSFNLPSGKPNSQHILTPVSVLASHQGAVAGKPVANLINRCIAGLYSRMDSQRYAIIASGGVFSAKDAYLKICLGASLVQIYSALIYEGPGVLKTIQRGLAERLRRDGFANVQSAVGTAT